MNHREATLMLVDLTDGLLDDHRRHELILHVESCTACQAWLETYDLLRFETITDALGDHVDSDLLAMCAMRPEELEEPGRLPTRQHLDDCAVCRRDMETVRSAVLEARPKADVTAESTPARIRFSWWKIAAAASVATVALWLGLSFNARRPVGVDWPTRDITTPVASTANKAPETRREELSEMEIEGVRHIESNGTLTLRRVKIKDGAVVTIQAVEGVAFGDGFQIGSDALVAIGSSHNKPARDHVRTPKSM